MLLLLQNRATPLMVAAQHGHAQVVTRLVEAGANVNAADQVQDSTR